MMTLESRLEYAPSSQNSNNNNNNTAWYGTRWVFISCTKERNKIDTYLWSRKNIHSKSGARMKPQVFTMVKQGHVKFLIWTYNKLTEWNTTLKLFSTSFCSSLFVWHFKYELILCKKLLNNNNNNNNNSKNNINHQRKEIKW